MPPCPRCSTENPFGAAACVRCGTPLAQAPGAPYGQPPTVPYQQPPQAPYQQPPQPQFPPPQQQYQQPPQPQQQQYQQPPQPQQQQYQQPPQQQQPAAGYAQPPQAIGMPPAAPTMAAAGQPAYGAPPAPAQPLGSPGAAAPAGGDEDPERPLKIGGFPSKFGAAFCYVPVCGCLPLLYGVIAAFAEDKQNKFVRFHAFQSIFLWAGLIVFEIIVFILQMLVGMVLRMTGMYEIAGIIGIVFMALFSLVGLVVFAGLCAGVVLSFMGKATRLPLIGNFAAKQAGMTV